MNSIYLSLIIKLIGFLSTSDLFAVERAALARRINPTLLAVIEEIVASVDGRPNTSGAEKKELVLQMLPESLKPLSTNLINQAIEWAVAKLRAAK